MCSSCIPKLFYFKPFTANLKRVNLFLQFNYTFQLAIFRIFARVKYSMTSFSSLILAQLNNWRVGCEFSMDVSHSNFDLFVVHVHFSMNCFYVFNNDLIRAPNFDFISTDRTNGIRWEKNAA